MTSRPQASADAEDLEQTTVAPADRLFEALGADRAEELIEFLDADEDGSYLLERGGGHVRASLELVPRLWVRWRKAV